MDTGSTTSEPFIGEIKLLVEDFAPRGWAYCSGQLLPIHSHSALFSLIGTKFGGDGKEKFKLPKIPPVEIPKPEKESEEQDKEPAKTEKTDTTNLQPYLQLHWIIALQGVYPSRN